MSVSPPELVPPKARANGRAASWAERWRAVWLYALFCAYGGGSSWLAVDLSWLQLPVYQERSGLDIASKMSMGYQIGALAVPGFILARRLLSLVGRNVNYVALIWVLLVAQGAVCVLGVADAHYWWVPVWINVLGGLLGYATDAVHQGFILMNFDIIYVGAYWVGGDIAGLYGAGVALLQQPGLGREGRRFGPRAFYLLSLTMVPLAMLAFWFVNHSRSAAPPPGSRGGAQQQGGHGGAAQVESASGELSQRNTVISQSSAANSLLQDVEGRGGTYEALHTMDSATLLKKESEAVSELTRSSTAISLLKDVETLGDVGEAFQNTDSATLLKNESEGTLRSLLPQGLRKQPWLSFMIVASTAWVEFGCWGVGDPISAYACAHGSKEDEGLACVAGITEGSIVVSLLGRLVASALLRLGHQCRKPWIGVFFSLFNVALVLMSLAASVGGIWSSLGGTYVVAIVLLLRFLWSVVLMLNLAILQEEYDESDLEDMNIFTSLVRQVSSVLGTILMYALIADGEIS